MSRRPIHSWIAPLQGHAFDIEDLPIYLDGSSVTVVKRSEKHFLQLSASVAGTSYEQVSEFAERFLALINGAGRILIHGYRPIELEGGSFYGIDENGNVAHTVIQVGTAEMRCKPGHATIEIGGVAQPDKRKGSMNVFLKYATQDQAKADALAILGRLSPSWSELYLVYELVEANVGSRMFTDGWIGRKEAKLFKRTANSYTALGKAGRHGKDRGDPPDEPMQQQDALVLMRTLVAAWFQDRAQRDS